MVGGYPIWFQKCTLRSCRTGYFFSFNPQSLLMAAVKSAAVPAIPQIAMKF